MDSSSYSVYQQIRKCIAALQQCRQIQNIQNNVLNLIGSIKQIKYLAIIDKEGLQNLKELLQKLKQQLNNFKKFLNKEYTNEVPSKWFNKIEDVNKFLKDTAIKDIDRKLSLLHNMKPMIQNNKTSKAQGLSEQHLNQFIELNYQNFKNMQFPVSFEKQKLIVKNSFTILQFREFLHFLYKKFMIKMHEKYLTQPFANKIVSFLSQVTIQIMKNFKLFQNPQSNASVASSTYIYEPHNGPVLLKPQLSSSSCSSAQKSIFTHLQSLGEKLQYYAKETKLQIIEGDGKNVTAREIAIIKINQEQIKHIRDRDKRLQSQRQAERQGDRGTHGKNKM